MQRAMPNLRTPVLLCVAASLALPTTALAAYGPKRGVYGGKATGGAPAANRVHPVSVALSKDGKKIKQLRLAATAACSPSGSLNTSPGWNDVKLARDGSFSDSDQFEQRSSDGSEVTTWSSTIEGRLTKRGGSGKARDVATVRDPDGNVTKTCDTGVVRFNLGRGERVLGGAVNLGRGFPAFGALYPVSIQRNRGGDRITAFRIRYMAKCGTTNHHTNSFVHSDIDLDGNGEFSASRKFTYKSATGTTRFKGTFTLRGQLGASRGSGTYRAKFRALLADGTELPCDTGRRKWSVSQR
jgi:hypothetical protein